MVQVKGGDKFAEALNNRIQKLTKAKTVDVGFLEDATYPDGTQVAMVAALQEFGAPGKGVPPRPFFRTMISKRKSEWAADIKGSLEANEFDANKTLGQIGALVTGQLQESIIETNSPALSPITVMLRGLRGQSEWRDKPFWERFAEAKKRVAAGQSNFGASEKPLVDSGHMLASANYAVKS